MAAQLLVVLDNKITQERAQQLLEEAEGSVDAAVAIFFSSGQQDAGNPAQPAASQQQQLAAILGPEVPASRLRRLLSRAGSVPRAADLFFSEAADAEPEGPGPSQPVQGTPPSGPAVRQRRKRRLTPRMQHAALSPDDSDAEEAAEEVAPPATETAAVPAHAPGARTMQTASSADLFRGFVSAIAAAASHLPESGQSDIFMEDDDDDEFDSDEEMEPMIFEVEDDVSPELDEEEAAAGPSASARGSNALGLVQSSRWVCRHALMPQIPFSFLCPVVWISLTLLVSHIKTKCKAGRCSDASAHSFSYETMFVAAM